MFMILALFLSLLFLSEAPGFAKDIKVLSLWNLSGIAGSYPEFGWGVMDAFDYINKQGGVNGKPIKSFLEDLRYDVPTGVALFTRYSASEPADELIIASGYMTGVLKALIDKVNKEQKSLGLTALIQQRFLALKGVRLNTPIISLWEQLTVTR